VQSPSRHDGMRSCSSFCTSTYLCSCIVNGRVY
jgi:hypothetical protein